MSNSPPSTHIPPLKPVFVCSIDFLQHHLFWSTFLKTHTQDTHIAHCIWNTLLQFTVDAHVSPMLSESKFNHWSMLLHITNTHSQHVMVRIATLHCLHPHGAIFCQQLEWVWKCLDPAERNAALPILLTLSKIISESQPSLLDCYGAVKWWLMLFKILSFDNLSQQQKKKYRTKGINTNQKLIAKF